MNKLALFFIFMAISSCGISEEVSLTDIKSQVFRLTGAYGGTGFQARYKDMSFIISNSHVCRNRTGVSLVNHTGLYKKAVLKDCPMYDLCLIEPIDDNGLSLSDKFFTPGNPVTYLGFPGGKGSILVQRSTIRKIYKGIYLIREGLNIPKEDYVIWVDSPVMRGHSGSPLLNTSSEVIGVIFQRIEYGDEVTGEAIPVQFLKEVLDDYIEDKLLQELRSVKGNKE